MTPRRKASSQAAGALLERVRDSERARNSALVRLRAFGEGDAAWADEWFGGVAAAVAYPAIDAPLMAGSSGRLLGEDRSLRARVIERKRARVGIILYRVDEPRRSEAIFEIVAVPDAEARRGSGMMAAAVAEREMHELGARTIYAPASAVHGISVYFWIRLGYAPLQQSEWPCERSGVLWLRRHLTPTPVQG